MLWHDLLVLCNILGCLMAAHVANLQAPIDQISHTGSPAHSESSKVESVVIPPADGADEATAALKPDPVPSETPDPALSIIDVLSSNIQYSYFLRHLQRNGLIPFINKLENVTLLAPVNSAFAGSDRSNGGGQAAVDEFEWDNNKLLRYIVSQVVCTEDLGKDSVIYNTYYDNPGDGTPYPILVSYEGDSNEYIIDQEATIVEPDIYALHQGSYIQGVDSLLSIKPTMCQFLMANDIDSVNGHKISFIKTLFSELFGEAPTLDASAEDDLFEDFAVEDVVSDSDDDELDSPESILAKKGKTKKDKRKKKKKKHKKSKPRPLPKSCSEFMNGTKTMFIPTDTYIHEHFTPLQIKYYLSLAGDYDEGEGEVQEGESFLRYDTTKAAAKETKYDIINLLENLLLSDLVGGINGTHKDTHKSVSGAVSYKTEGKADYHKICINKAIDSIKDSSNIVVSDGIIHLFGEETHTEESHIESKKDDNHSIFFSSFNLPIEMIPRKSLYALHFSNFVEELYFRRLEYLVDGSTADQTIIINAEDRDDVPDDEVGISSFSSKQNLLYQFLDEVIDPVSNEDSYYLADTKLCSKKRIGKCFKAKVTISGQGELIKINDNVKVIETVHVTNNTMVYITDKENEAPGSLKHSLVEIISGSGGDRYWDHIIIDTESCLEVFKDLNENDLFSLDDNGKGYSLFLPCGKSQSHTQLPDVAPVDEAIIPFGGQPQLKSPWENLGLTLVHLKKNPDLYKSVLQGLFIKGTIYSDFEGKGSYKSLAGDRFQVAKVEGQGSDHLTISINDTILDIPLNSDILFNQGVVHIVNEMLLPDSLSINMLDLVKTTFDADDAISFLDLIEKYPKLSKKVFGNATENEFSLLVPSPDSLTTFNLSTSFDKLWDFLEFHLIPKTELDTLLECINGIPQEPEDGEGYNLTYTSIHTNYSGTTLNCRTNPQNGKTYLQLNDPKDIKSLSYNKDHEVHILSYGCTRQPGGKKGYDGDTSPGSCVFLIDKPLNLAWLQKPSSNFLHVSLGIVSVGIGIVVGLIMFGIVMLGVAMCLNKKNMKQKQLNGGVLNGDIFSPRSEPSFMSVLDSSDDNTYDRGYETDDDMLRSEHEQLLPTTKGRRRYTGGNGKSGDRGKFDRSNGNVSSDGGYGSTRDNSRSPTYPTGPLPISSKSITYTLNRERNLPSVM